MVNQIIYRVTKHNSAFDQPREWSNQYVLECEYDVGSPQCEADALTIAYAESTLHLSTTEYYLVTAGRYGELANAPVEVSEVSYPLTRWGIRGDRLPDGLPAEKLSLRLTKQVRGGRNGRAQLFGCLNESDCMTREDDSVVLLEAGELQYRLDYLFRGLYWDNVGGTLVVPQSATSKQAAWQFLPAEWRIGHVSRNNARFRSFMARKEKAVGAFERVKGMLSVATIYRQRMAESIYLEHDFHDEGFQSWTQAIVTGTVETAQAVKTWLETGEQDAEGETVYLSPRFGASSSEMAALYNAWSERMEIDLESIDHLKPYVFVDDLKYTSQDTAEALMDYVNPWLAKIAELADFDFFSPIYIRDVDE